MKRKSIEKDAEEFLKIVERLKEKHIIVEGKKDKKALNTLGLKNIIAINGKPLVRIADMLAGSGIKDVVILTDFDRQGRKIASRLRCLLQRLKIKVNPILRKELMEFGKTRIEEFDGALEQLEVERQIGGDGHGKTRANIDKIHDKSHDKGKRCNRKTRRDRSHIWSDRRSAWF